MNKLAVLNSIESRIAKIETLDEAKGIRDQAEALRVYAKSAKAGLGVQNRAAKVKILAEHRAGTLLKAIPRQNGKKDGSKGIRATIAQIQIPIQTAHRWEAMSEIPAEKIEQAEIQRTEAGEELTSGDIFRMARTNRAAANQPPEIEDAPPLPDTKFKAIVIDPPWPITKIVFNRRPVEKESLDYPTMTLEEIGLLPVASLAEESGCHVWLWFTHKHLPDALELFRKWGVRYECIITWNKPTAQPLWWRSLERTFADSPGHCCCHGCPMGPILALCRECYFPAVTLAVPRLAHAARNPYPFRL